MQKNETVISEERIDGGREFAWGRTSDDYARWRNSYPPETLAAFCEEHERLLERIAPESFDIPHTLELLVLRSTK